MAPFSKPETVLKQAEGLVSVGQTHAALQSLTEMFQSKRFRSAPLASLEPIMIRFVELCVDLRKGRTAKEGLMQYKNIAQNSSVASIEVVINKFIQLADAKVQEAQAQAEKATADIDVDDLEAIETPESILLGAVSGDQSKDRTDRALVTPWLKFLWESYRTALETLKNNARLETIYQQVAQQAFKFCLKHQRKVEFRRLCETLRLHLQNVAKYAHQQHSINLSDQDTLQRHLDTRFAQLSASVELELWQEAFRSVEDVHNLLTMAKKTPRPAMMANYYEKLTRIFLMSGNALYHAAAWGKYQATVLSMGGKSEEELSRLAGQVLVATLAVPVGSSAPAQSEADEGKARGSRLTSLLALTKPPTRAGLLRDALQRGALKLAPPLVRELYTALEATFDPLSLCNTVAPLLQQLSSDSAYASYVPLLQRALLSRLLAQLSEVYASITLSSLMELVSPLKGSDGGAGYDDAQVEAYVMGCARRGELAIRVDHAAGCIIFVDDAFSTDPSSSSAPATIREGQVQSSNAEVVRTRLQKLASGLHEALARIEPPVAPSEEDQQEKLKALVSAANAERKRLQVRRALVARRRELLAEIAQRKDKEAASRRLEQARREREAAERAERERERNDMLRRIEQERQNVRDKETQDLVEKLRESKILKVGDEAIKGMDTDDLMRLQVEQLEKEKKETSDRLRQIAKRIDHLERAFRKEERPLLAEDYARQQAEDKRTFETLQVSRVEGARAAHTAALETKARLARMMDDYVSRRDAVNARRGEEIARKKEKAAKKIEEEKQKRRAQVLEEREKERLQKEEEERRRREREEEERRQEEERRAEEERAREEEEARLAAEEEENRKKEEAAIAARKQREEERAAAAEAARKQAQREEEALARRAANRSQPAAATPSRPTPLPATEGGWRSRAAAQAQQTPQRTESPRPERAAPAPTTPAATSAYRPGAFAKSSGGGWREREAAKGAASSGGAASPSSPAPSTPVRTETPKPETKQDDGFQTVEKKPQGVWRPSRGRGRGQ